MFKQDALHNYSLSRLKHSAEQKHNQDYVQTR